MTGTFSVLHRDDLIPFAYKRTAFYSGHSRDIALAEQNIVSWLSPLGMDKVSHQLLAECAIS